MRISIQYYSQAMQYISGCHVALFPVYCKQANWVVRRVAGGRHVVCIKPVNINRQSTLQGPIKVCRIKFHTRVWYGQTRRCQLWNQSKPDSHGRHIPPCQEEEWTVSNNIEAKLCMFDGNPKPCLATVHFIAVLRVKLKKILVLVAATFMLLCQVYPRLLEVPKFQSHLKGSWHSVPREISSQRGISIWHTGIWSPCSISDMQLYCSSV